MLRTFLAVFSTAMLVVVRLFAAPPGDATSDANGRRQSIQHRESGSPFSNQDLVLILSDDLEDGALHKFTLFQAALIAGGVESRAELQEYTADFNRVCDRFADEVKPLADSRSKLDLVLRRLHERWLTGEYRPNIAELRQTLDHGEYNCVTATLLFQSLCDRCGLSTRAVAAQSHVLCCLPGSPTLYAETTCKDCRSAVIEDCPPQIQTLVNSGRELTPTQLLGKVYYNLGVARLEDARFADAAELLETSLRLDPQDHAAHENLLATFNNWSLAECDRGQFEAAHKILLHGLTTDPGYRPLLANDLHVHQRWVRRLCKVADFASAIGLLEQCFQRRPDVELFDRGRIAVYELWAEHHFVRGELDAGWDVLADCQLRFGSAANGSREIAVIQAACDELLQANDSAVVVQLLGQAIERYPNSDDLVRLKSDLLEAGL